MKWLVHLSAILMVVMLAGCETLRTTNQIVHTKGAEAYDESLNSSIQFTCNDTSVGSIKRRFGVSEEAMRRWLEFCYGDNAMFMIPASQVKEASPPVEPKPAVPNSVFDSLNKGN